MTCDDFLPALETGGFWRRAAARRHAAHCPACRRTLAAWLALKQELAAAPPLTDRQHRVWTSVALPGPARTRASFRWLAAAAAVAASLLLFVLFWSLRSRDIRREQPAPVAPQVEVAPISPESIAAALSPLEQRLDRMESELTALSRRAELVDLKRQTVTLLEEYRHW